MIRSTCLTGPLTLSLPPALRTWCRSRPPTTVSYSCWCAGWNCSPTTSWSYPNSRLTWTESLPGSRHQLDLTPLTPIDSGKNSCSGHSHLSFPSCLSSSIRPSALAHSLISCLSSSIRPSALAHSLISCLSSSIRPSALAHSLISCLSSSIRPSALAHSLISCLSSPIRPSALAHSLISCLSSPIRPSALAHSLISCLYIGLCYKTLIARRPNRRSPLH